MENSHSEEIKRYIDDETEVAEEETVGEPDSVVTVPAAVPEEYDITSTPNDFNVKTIFDFLSKGIFVMPDFQRNYVWDIKRASRLIESLLMGLPIPQIFLFEEERNSFLVIDGQQRLMTVYFFLNGRFPKVDKRAELRPMFDKYNGFDKRLLEDDEYFVPFRLRLPSPLKDRKNPLDGKRYENLGELQRTLDLRVVRNVVIRQNTPREHYQSKFEIFNRLNTGGVNLTPQEIRASLFYSRFYDKLRMLNLHEGWRRFLPNPKPDLHQKDVEVLLRAFAMLKQGDSYRPSMIRFLNEFSEKAKSFADDEIEKLGSVLHDFLDATAELPSNTFQTRGRFNIALFEAVFIVFGERWLKGAIPPRITGSLIRTLSEDVEFTGAASKSSAATANVKLRLSRARTLMNES